MFGNPPRVLAQSLLSGAVHFRNRMSCSYPGGEEDCCILWSQMTQLLQGSAELLRTGDTISGSFGARLSRPEHRGLPERREVIRDTAQD